MSAVEHNLNCALIASGDYAAVVSLGIKVDFYTDDTEGRIFELIEEHLLEYRKVPGKDAVLLGFPNYDFSEPPEPVEFYAHELKGEHIFRTLMAGFTKISEELFSDPTVDGYALQSAFTDVLDVTRFVSSVGAPVSLFGTNVEFYLRENPIRRANEHLRGISTGYRQLDEAIGGYQKEQLITFVGLPKHGKSTMMLSSAFNAQRLGERVLYVTFEMRVDENRDRINSLVTGLPITKIEQANYTALQEDDFFRELRKAEAWNTFMVIEDPKSMMSINGVNHNIIELRPDIVFIDGFYKMDAPGRDRRSRDALDYLTDELKRLAQNHHIPIVVSTQALQSRSKGGLTMASAAYSQTIQEDSDTLIGVYKVNDTLSQFKVLASRSGKPDTIYLRIDWDHGYIGEVDKAIAMAEIQAASGQGTLDGQFVLMADLMAVLQELGLDHLHDGHREISASCPAHKRITGHDDGHPSWSISKASGLHICYSCGWKGDIASLYREMREEMPTDLLADMQITTIRQTFHEPDEDELVPLVPDWDWEHEKAQSVPVPTPLREHRHLSADALNHYDVLWNRERACWMLPFTRSDGSVYGAQYRVHGSEMNMPDGVDTKSSLFGIDKVLDSKNVTLVESPLDAVRLWQVGAPAVASYGTWVSMEQIALLQYHFRIVILAMDADTAGRDATERIKRTLLRRGMGYLDFDYLTYNPDSADYVKDPGDYDTDEELYLRWNRSFTFQSARISGT